MFLLLLALLIGLVLGQFIKIELPTEAKQELIRAIKSLPGTAKAAFNTLLQELRQQRQSIDPLAGSTQLTGESINGKSPNQGSIKAVVKEN